MAKAPAHVLETLRRHPDLLRMPLEPMHGWRSSPDEGGHSHCEFCAATIYRCNPVVGCYLEYVSTVFCPDCVRDNPELFREWLASRPGEPQTPNQALQPPAVASGLTLTCSSLGPRRR